MTHGTHPLGQVNLVVRDMEATRVFYGRLGWVIEGGPEHASCQVSEDLSADFDAQSFVPSWDSGYRGGSGGTTVLSVGAETRADVDALYAELVAAGYTGRQPPYDAFWGSRYAIVEDPDGNPVGIMSGRDAAMRSSHVGFTPPKP